MNENTKTITADEFAPILWQAFIRAGVCYPENKTSDKLHYKMLCSIEQTLRSKVSKDINITDKSILTIDIISKVIEAYEEAAKKYASYNWYNLLRKSAWEIARAKAFTAKPLSMKVMPVSTLSNEFNYYAGKGAGQNKRFNVLVRKHFPRDIVLSEEEFKSLIGKTDSAKENEILQKMYDIHFALEEGPAQKPEVVEVKDLDKKVVQQMNTTQEVELVMNDYIQVVNGIVAGIIKQLEALNQAKGVELDDNEKDRILAAIGYKNVLEEARQSKKKIAELTEQVERLEKEIANNEDVRKRLLCILGDVAA